MEIPNLWSSDEREMITKSLKNEAAELDIHENLMDLVFRKKVLNNLHIILTMSPVGDQLRNRIRTFPSLICTCKIDWFDSWPREALV